MMKELQDFVKFLMHKVYLPAHFDLSNFIEIAFEKTFADVRYHYPELSPEVLMRRIVSNQNELAIFLYRLGSSIFHSNPKHPSLDTIHWLMRECCSCEIYYSTEIDEGFYVVHGVGTVIGSRNKIGKGFKIYQNCTIGHKQIGGKGCVIGHNVIMYAGSQIIGELTIGNDVTIGCASVVLQNIPSNSICVGIPARPLEK